MPPNARLMEVFLELLLSSNQELSFAFCKLSLTLSTSDNNNLCGVPCFAVDTQFMVAISKGLNDI